MHDGERDRERLRDGERQRGTYVEKQGGRDRDEERGLEGGKTREGEGERGQGERGHRERGGIRGDGEGKKERERAREERERKREG